MWELIQANKKKSTLLFVGMGVLLLLLGFVIGLALIGPNGGLFGILIALGVWAILSAISYFAGDSIILTMSGAQEVTHDIHPQLFNVVEEMKIAANLPVMPKVYIINERAPNAFATGRSPKKCAIAVTAGLLAKLNRDELQGVVAHEMSHILNRDILFMTFAGIMVGSIVLLSDGFLRSLWYGSGSNRRYRSGKSSGGGGYVVLIAIIFAVLAPVIARLFYFAISRKREYLADASAVRLTRYPDGLASALETISGSSERFHSANRITAPMYINNPLTQKEMGLSGLNSTHPPIQSRIKILRAMSSGAGYQDYMKAYAGVAGGAAVLPGSALGNKDSVAIRKPSVDPNASKKQGKQDVGDLIRAVNGFAFLACTCGLKMKIPPNFKKPTIDCPRCGTENKVPVAELAAMAAAVEVLAPGTTAGALGAQQQTKQTPQQEMNTYVRQGNNWESFYCSCGRMLQISPTFSASHIACKTCGRKTLVKT